METITVVLSKEQWDMIKKTLEYSLEMGDAFGYDDFETRSTVLSILEIT